MKTIGLNETTEIDDDEDSGLLTGWLDRANLARLAVKLAERPSFAETAPRE